MGKEKLNQNLEKEIKSRELEEFQRKKKEEDNNLKNYLRDSYKSLADQHRMKVDLEK